MKNLLILFCSLLILAGVFCADEVSMKEGESVTLEIKTEEKNGASELVWKFKENIIGTVNVNKNESKVYETKDEIFGDRLNLDNHTGFLTITNIRSQHSGLYKLEIKGIRETNKIFRVSVIDEVKVLVMEGDNVTLKAGVTDGNIKDVKWKFNGADLSSKVNPQTGDLIITNIRLDQSGEYEVNINSILHRIYRISVSDEVKVSVMERDSFTLNTGVTGGKIDDVKWKFNGDVIANLTDTNTGNLIITNIRRDQSGEYKVEINGGGFIIHRTIRVNVSVKPESVSVNVGEDFTLCPNLIDIQRDDVKVWTYEDNLIAHSNRKPYIVPYDGRFTGRLHLDLNGCLTITNFRPGDSGRYDVNITGSKHILHKRFSVTSVTEPSQTSHWVITGPGLPVTEPSQTSHWVITGPVLAVVLLLLVLLVSFIIYKRYRKKKSQKDKNTSETSKNEETLNLKSS